MKNCQFYHPTDTIFQGHIVCIHEKNGVEIAKGGNQKHNVGHLPKREDPPPKTGMDAKSLDTQTQF